MRDNPRRLILGIDEAGYGPNLGPLVIGCSAWIIDDLPSSTPNSKPAAESLLDRLAPSFLPKPRRLTFEHIPLGDSKALYTSGDSTDSLALGVRYWMNQQGAEMRTFQDFLEAVAPNSAMQLATIPWYQLQHIGRSSSEHFTDLGESISALHYEAADQACRAAGVQFLGLAATVIDEGRFNLEVERLGNKASLLSNASLQLATDCLLNFANPIDSALTSIDVYCDKHGGRNRYQALLMHAMPELWFDVFRESAPRSDYRARWQDRELNWSFLAKGDRLFASALSSMTAKWIREALMERLNRFWQTQLPDLKSTAGYPVDAKRFRNAIEPIADQLGFQPSDWWRSR